ncbi:MAG: tRNA (guanosine(46)-N7)-methyltransferase TrmB [Aestuariivita sp.]|nr:tRNA (guanosine(46)-N7)-methyltransferase TrmB [Aestuariivita sp.]MCY4346840.1 tRNA (guanosine(46)-N7)-methyltransferase TrmB [Aestuariivita sp.]
MIEVHRPHRNFYGRIKGHPLSRRQQAYLNEDLADWSLDHVTWVENPERQPIDLETIFGDADIRLEIGFGSGEHLVLQAEQNPKIGFIGAEPYVNGVAALLAKLQERRLSNLRIFAGDVRDLMDVLPEGSIAVTYLLYPDPWPKKRHHRRRFVTSENLGPLARIMRSDGIVRIATDIPDYARQALEELPKFGFEWLAQSPSDWRQPWPNWVSTRYEQKALRHSRVPHYLTFSRLRCSKSNVP